MNVYDTMQIPLAITFRHMDSSPAVEQCIRENAEKLEQFCDEIIRCDVVIETPHKHHQQGNLFHIRIDITVPGNEIVVKRAPAEHHAYEDAYVAIRDAFDASRRQLQDYVRKRRGKVKAHSTPAHGRVFHLDPAESYGMLRTPDGREVYFHRNSLVDANFDGLTVGTELRFTEEMGEKGAQASTVHIVGKHHRTP